ncbi:exopolysaccharide biosynthesis protein [Rhodobacteraceae bacterium M382]|nr:exopolysaccharide biosynthesis protein [Rhodobacteraceae bacterium M382]
MRDFESSDLEDYFAEAAHLEDTEAMTEQGFKRFRRKNRPRPMPDARVSKDIRDPQANLSPVVDEEPEFRIQLPAPTPEPWELLRQVPLGVRRHILRRSSLISFFREDPAAKQFDLLRTRLLKTLKERGWSRVAVVSPTSGCGTTFAATNLALSLSRVPEIRTVLMDLNQRDPGIGDALDIQALGDMPGFLMGEVPLQHHLVRCSETLAVGIAGAADRNAAEILHDPQTAETLDHMRDALKADVVLYDLPPLLEHDDLMAFLPQVDGVLLVADGQTTTAADLEACERVLDNQTQLLGVLLNRGR